ncbi:MAG: hypothetical protein ACM3MG_10065 [Bacillota bacterium]
MPEVKHYEGKKKQTHTKDKRRPHHEHATEHELEAGSGVDTDESVEITVSEDINTEAQNEGVSAAANSEPSEEYLAQKDMISEGAPADAPSEKTQLEFYGSEVIRQKAPKVMELADTVADEWKKDGQFEGLPVGNPLAQVAAAKVLRKAKDVEKKLEEKGVFAMAKMGLEYAKAEIEKRKKH